MYHDIFLVVMANGLTNLENTDKLRYEPVLVLRYMYYRTGKNYQYGSTKT